MVRELDPNVPIRKRPHVYVGNMVAAYHRVATNLTPQEWNKKHGPYGPMYVSSYTGD